MPIGRPREFDVELALDRALAVFWRQGYEGASLPELTRAMGISRPSLYAAFGNKEALFRRALDRYDQELRIHVHKALLEPTSRAVVERVLYGTIDVLTSPHHPRGCLFVQGALACSDENDCVRRELISRRAASEAALRRRLARARAEGDLPADSDPADLARYVATISQGMAVQAASGATRRQLKATAKLALAAWPT